MTDPVGEIKALLDRIAEKDMSALVAPLTDIAMALTDLVAAVEDDEDEDDALVQAVIDGFRNLKIPAPTVQVTVPQAEPPDIVVNVPQALPAQVVIQSAESKGWTLTITGRDGGGNIRSISLKPE
jgi:hypothetical protein